MNPEVSQAIDLIHLVHPERAARLREQIHSASQPSQPLCELANELIAQRRTNPATRVFLAALRLDPLCVTAHRGLGLLLEAEGFLEDAVDSFETTVGLEGSSEHHYLLGRALHQSGQVARSAQHYEMALRLDPNNVDALCNLGLLFHTIGRLEDAVASFTEVTRRAPQVARAWTSLGALMSQLGNNPEAIRCLSEAVSLEPGNALAHANLADALRTADRTEEARNHAERSASLDPSQVLAPSICARLALQAGQFEEAREQLLALLTNHDCGALKGRILVDLAMAHDRLGDHDLAFNTSSEGQALLSAQSPANTIDVSAYPARVQAIAAWTPKALAAPPPSTQSSTRSPCFLVGFPRSGTTLTEQILAAHPRVNSLDERPFLDQVIEAGTDMTTASYPLCIDQLTETQVQQLRERYWDLLKADSTIDQDRLVLDKMPLNLVHIGLIRRLFPEAQLIVALRDPRDCCLSAFMQDFVPNEAMVQFHSLERTTALYAQVMGLWLDNRSALANPWIESRYEDLVDDLEGAARRLLSFLDLPWDQAVLHYHQHASRRHISTPSHQDVQKPIFRRALRRWQRYEKHFVPFEERLRPFITAFGYN